jgi:hypothetical protein
VGPQYDSTHVFVDHGTLSAFTTSWEATFGGTNTTPTVTDVTPTPSKTWSELILSPVGTVSVFDYLTPVPYPFGAERTGWLMKDFNQGVRAARVSGRTSSSRRSPIRWGATRSSSSPAASTPSSTGTPRHRRTRP